MLAAATRAAGRHTGGGNGRTGRSTLRSEGDICEARLVVSAEGPTTGSCRVDIAASFEHSVRTHEDCFGDANPEGFRGLEVHDQIEPRRAFDRKIGRLGAAQNATNVTAATAKHIGKVWPIGDETPCVHMSPVKKYRR